MTRKYFCLLLGLVFWTASPFGFAQTPAATAVQPQDSDALYRQALDTYLNGDYDQAILLAAKSVEADPKNQKAENLLLLLTNEKKDIGNYEIWLSTHPSAKLPGDSGLLTASEPPPSGSPAGPDEIGAVQKRLNIFYAAQTRENGQFEGQIQAVSELLRENSNHQYDELRKSQVDLLNEMENASRGNERNLWILYLLCFGSMFLSACALWSIGRHSRRG